MTIDVAFATCIVLTIIGTQAVDPLVNVCAIELSEEMYWQGVLREMIMEVIFLLLIYCL